MVFFVDTNYHIAAFSVRDVGEHGGTMILCKNSIAFLNIQTNCDYVSCILLPDISTLIICVYNPPSGSRFRVSSQELVNTLKPILSNHSNSSKIIGGDLNIPDIDWDCALASSDDSADTLDCLLNAGFEQVIEFATHSSGNTLDLCFTDMSLKSIPCKRVVDFSDHIGVIANLKIENLVTAVNENTTNISLKVKNFHAYITQGTACGAPKNQFST